MKSAKLGFRTSPVEVTNVSPQGFWLLIDGQEKLIAFAVFPWFLNATIGELVRVERPSPEHLYWPLLDIDIAVASIDHPKDFPLMARLRPSTPLNKTKAPRLRTNRRTATARESRR